MDEHQLNQIIKLGETQTVELELQTTRLPDHPLKNF